MDGFGAHGIRWLSPASLNAWAAEPALWLIERLLRVKVPPGGAVHRGSAAEAGIVTGLIHPQASVEACVEHALADYDRCTTNLHDASTERAAIPGLIAQGLAALRPYGVPDAINHRVVHAFADVSVSVVGYLDLAWSRHGIVVDLKTTTRTAPSVSSAHARQVSLYAYPAGYEARLAYVSPQGSAIYRIDEPDRHLEALRQIALRLERFLSLSPDPTDLATLLTPNYDNYRWRNPEMRAHGRALYGF